MPNVINVRFRSKGKAYFFDPAETTPRIGDSVIVETAKGIELGECVRAVHMVDEAALISPLRPVLRIATDADKALAASNREKEQTAFEFCQKKIDDHKLDMKLVDVEYSFDGSKILFFFTSDGRVDFRELVKDLAGVFHTRIELRQIGVRDSAKLVGGLGICGRPFCCSTFLDDFQPVSIKMAKSQSLSLNPTKISGTCGRLMCCLKYEQDAYEHLLKTVPKVDTKVDTPDGKGTVIAVNLLRRTVKVKLDDESFGDTPTFRARELGYMVNGEYKAPEPPEEDELPIEKETTRFTNYTTRTTPSGRTVASVAAKMTSEETPAAEEEPTVETPSEAPSDSGKKEHGQQHRRGGRHHRGGGKKPPQSPAAASVEQPQQKNARSAAGTDKPQQKQHQHRPPASERREHSADAPQTHNQQNHNQQHHRKPHRNATPRGGAPSTDEKARARADAIAAAVAQAKPKGNRSHRPHGGKKPSGDGAKSE